ncbi:MAG: beta-ketoacyl-[acyl-carrier-protein] synthase family protein [Phycisphaerae bacterium]
MAHRVVITGAGWVTPLGHDIETVWARLLQGESGVASTTVFDASTFPTRFAAEVKGFDLKDFLADDADRHAHASRNARFALGAAQRAWEDSGLTNWMALAPSEVGVYLGGGEGPVDFFNFAEAVLAGWHGAPSDEKGTEARRHEGTKGNPQSPIRNPQSPIPHRLDGASWGTVAMRKLSRVRELEQDPNLAAGHIAVQFNAAGPNFNTLTACAASTQAIGEAALIIKRGDVNVMISGGTHSMIHPLGVTGFNRLTALSTRNDTPRQASRPFDRSRDGFVLGEGAGVVILESLEHAKARGAHILGEIVGYGSTADAFRVTDIHDQGRGPVAAMRNALDAAGMFPETIDYISAHGTGTSENDNIETLSIKQVFGDRAKDIPVSSIKSMIGHLIAAAGVVELIVCLLAIRDGMVPPTINYEHPDPACDLDYVPGKARKHPVRTALSNSFGFGGQNDTLIVTAYHDD